MEKDPVRFRIRKKRMLCYECQSIHHPCPAASSLLPPGILADNTLYVAGILSLAKDMKTTVGIGDIRVQTRHVIDTIKTIVEEAGGTLRDITFNSIFIRNLEDYAGMNEVYGEYFNESPPARYAFVRTWCLRIA